MAGSGKSTTCHMIKALIDPNKAPLLSQPKPSELRVISNGYHLLGFDNFSKISPELRIGLVKLLLCLVMRSALHIWK